LVRSINHTTGIAGLPQQVRLSIMIDVAGADGLPAHWDLV
jgi:hypothetical protein